MKKKKSENLETIGKLMENISINELAIIKKTAESKIKNSVNFDWNAGSELPF